MQFKQEGENTNGTFQTDSAPAPFPGAGGGAAQCAQVMNVVKYRKYHSPVMSAAKVISLAAALVSMLSLETAMLAQFDKGQNPKPFRRIMTGCTGGGVCAMVLGIAVYMVIQSTKQLGQLKAGS